MNRLSLFIIKFFSRWAYTTVAVKDELTKVEPVIDDSGQPLVLEYYGKRRAMWRYKNENDIKIARSIWLKFFDSEKEQNITTDLLVKYAKDTIDNINGNDLAKAGSNMYSLLDIVQNLTPMDVLRNQFGVLLFDEEEDLGVFDMDRHQAKIRAMKTHPDQGFFFSTLLKLGGISGRVSAKEILSSLRKSEVKLRAYERMLSEQRGQGHTKTGGG